ncbi:hypothetical protein L218DRAFT_347242 [Marasmius fiardii PR-910]|nr:hypothetical protein L218DRAFT_347242 [Marasmius fiardii PR-910]
MRHVVALDSIQQPQVLFSHPSPSFRSFTRSWEFSLVSDVHLLSISLSLMTLWCLNFYMRFTDSEIKMKESSSRILICLLA